MALTAPDVRSVRIHAGGITGMNMVLRIGIGAVAGALVGLAIYKFIGCRTGACPIAANPYLSALVYGVIGALTAAWWR